jgi:hypothetical protein
VLYNERCESVELSLNARKNGSTIHAQLQLNGSSGI